MDYSTAKDTIRKYLGDNNSNGMRFFLKNGEIYNLSFSSSFCLCAPKDNKIFVKISDITHAIEADEIESIIKF